MGDWGVHEWCQQLVRDVVHSKKFEGREWAISLQFLAGAVSTGSWLQARGWQTEGNCECGAQDTLNHRQEGCRVREACPVRELVSGGLSIVQVDKAGTPVRWHAANLCSSRQ